MDNSNKQLELGRNKNIFSDALFISCITAIGYLGAFSYQYSFMSYYQIPSYLIEVNTTAVLFTCFSSLIVFCCIGILIIFIYRFSINKKYFRLLISILTSVLVFTPILLVYVDIYNWKQELMKIFFISVSMVLYGFILYRSSKIFSKHNNLIDKLEEIYGKMPILFVVTAILFIFVCGQVGSIKAKYNKIYLVSNSQPPFVIIGTFSNNFIVAGIDSINMTIKNEISLIELGKISPTTIKLIPQRINK
jgi:hypothetical protein